MRKFSRRNFAHGLAGGVLAPSVLGSASYSLSSEALAARDARPNPRYANVTNARDFGAIGDGINDDTAAIQAAIDHAVYGGGPNGMPAGAVFLPGGLYKISDTLHLGYGDSFRSAYLFGEGRRFHADRNFTGTAIIAAFNDRPAISVAGGRNTTIKALTIRGLNYRWIMRNQLGGIYVPKVNDLDAANWVDPSFPPSASSAYAPYCGIAIDPYAGLQPELPYPPVKYPSWLKHSGQYKKAPSSDTLIEEVEIIGFVVAIANHPCKSPGNGDYTKLMNCSIFACQYGVSVGNSQARLTRLSNCNVVTCHTGIATGAHGDRNGKPHFFVESSEFGNIIKWMDVPNTPYGEGVTFLNCYGEVIYTLGNGAPTAAATMCPVSFISCEMNFASWEKRGTPSAVFNAIGGGGVAFRNCVLYNSRGPAANVFVFAVDPYAFEFEGCMVRTGENAASMYEKVAINATCGVVVGNAGCDLRAFSTRQTTHFDLNSGQSRGAREVNQIATGSRKTGIPVYARRIICEEQKTTDPGFPFTAGGRFIDKATCSSITTVGRTVTVDATGSIANEWSLIQLGGEIGDVVVDQQTGTVFFVAARKGLRLTLVAQNGYDRNENLLKPISSTSYFHAVNCRRYTPYYVTLADSIAGKNTIKVARPDGYARYLDDKEIGLQPLDYLYVGTGTVDRPTDPSGGQIISIESGSLTLNSNMLHSGTRKRLTLFIRRAPETHDR